MRLKWVDHYWSIQDILGDLLKPLGVTADAIDSGEFVEWLDGNILYFTKKRPIWTAKIPKDAIEFKNGAIAKIDLTKVEAFQPVYISTPWDLFIAVDGKVIRYRKKGHGKYTTTVDETFEVSKKKIVPNKSGFGYATDALGFWARVVPSEEAAKILADDKVNNILLTLALDVKNNRIVYKIFRNN